MLGFYRSYNLPFGGTIALSCILTILGLWFIVFFSLRSAFIREISETFAGDELPEILRDFKVITRTPIYIVWYLIKFRANSVLKMVMDIFLRRIRSLQIESLFDDSRWRTRLQVNNIYTLENASEDIIGGEVKKVVEAANKMPTTLWFTEKEKEQNILDDLIACGQLTLCFNLIEYCESLKKENKPKKFDDKNIWENVPEEDKKKIEALHKELEANWEKFKQDPYWLLNAFKNEAAT